MSPTLDYDAINSNALARLDHLAANWFPAGRREGHEFKVGSLSGEPGRSLSINLKTGVWKDFSADVGGSDPISLLAAIRNCSMAEAARELGGLPAPSAVPQAKEEDWKPAQRAPAGAPSPALRHPRHGQPSKVWTYRTADGGTAGLIARFDKPDGSKEILPMCWAIKADASGWRWLSFPKPRPLYNLDVLAAHEAQGVLIVEGEKTADAAAQIFPGVVTTWPGGSKATKHADWSPLKGRRVLIWPDRDKPGRDAAAEIAKILGPIASSVRVVTPPDGEDDGWDLADAISDGWDRARLVEFLKADKDRASQPTQEPAEDEHTTFDQPPEFAPPSAEEVLDEMPFTILGHDNGRYFYLPHDSRQIVDFTASGHTKLNLLALAPMQWWEDMFPGKGANWDSAANALIHKAHRTLFDSSDIRGRGAWLDDGRAVFHAGDYLLVDGRETAISAIRSRYIYPRGRRMAVDAVTPASNKEAAKLISLCEGFRWRNPLDGKFFAGWLAVAPICGALEWRPHVWLNGPSGTGKTWIISNIVARLLSKSALFVNANTTEPGIRQQLGSDALPVVFDEAESEDREDQQRMKKILILARQASRESEGKIVKGTAGGSSQTFHVRSAFLFSSIGVSAVQRADMSRITPLELMRRTDPTEYATAWEAMVATWKDTAANADWCAALRARSLALAPTIAHNAIAFAAAAVPHLGQQRDADQIGALLAGAFSLTSRERVDDAFAAEWCAKQDWSTWRATDADADETRCLSHLLDALVMAELSSGGPASRVAVGELVQIAADNQSMAQDKAERALLRHGMAIRDGYLDVSNSHQELARIYDNTPWARKWRDQLQRITGAKAIGCARFGIARHRAVRVPMAMVMG